MPRPRLLAARVLTACGLATCGSALGHAVRQKGALCRYLDDGRSRIDNDVSESELRVTVKG